MTFARWVARISGLLLVLLVFVFLVGEGVPNVFAAPFEVQLEFLAMAAMLAGFLVGLRWEAVGGGLAIAGFTLFCGVEQVVTGKLPGGAIPLFAIPGVLLILSYFCSRQRGKCPPT